MPRNERFNVLSHLLGVLLAGAALLALVVPPLREGEFTKAICFTVYGASLIVTFLASTLFHLFRGDARDLLRRCDRIAIYFLIAGTYTPITLLRLPVYWGLPLLAVVWSMAVYGSVLEWREAKRQAPHSIALYLVMGWMSVLALNPLWVSLKTVGLVYLFLGGIIYTGGAALVRFTRLRRRHEIWHMAVLAGSACHFLVMVLFVS